MYQTDRGSYRTQESIARKFRNSCFGQIIIVVVTIGILLLIAMLTKPSDKTMKAEMDDNILQCIEERDSLNRDWLDDVVSNTGYVFTTSDSAVECQTMKSFRNFNNLQYYSHSLYNTVYLYNNFLPEGKRCGIGIFGIVIPMLDYNDFILHKEIMRTDSMNQKLIEIDPESEYFGENPMLEPFRFHGE